MTYTRRTWALEHLRRQVAAYEAAGRSEGSRNETLYRCVASSMDYAADGTLTAGEVEDAFLGVDVSSWPRFRPSEARKTIQSAVQSSGDASGAWYPSKLDGGPTGGNRPPTWTPKVVSTMNTSMPVARHNDGDVRLTGYHSTRATQGFVLDSTWTGLAEAVKSPGSWPDGGKDALPLWSAHEIEHDSRGRIDGRSPEVYALHALFLDYDDEPAFSMAQVRRWWGDVTHVAHTTASHLVDKGRGVCARGRVIVALSRPVTVAEYTQLARWVLGASVGKVGADELRTPNRAYYVPADAPQGYDSAAHLVGQALDVDTLLERIAEADAVAADSTPHPDVLEAMLYPKDDRTKEPRRLLVNAQRVFELDPRWSSRLAFCGFTRSALCDDERLGDNHVREAAIWMADVYGLHLGTDMVATAMQSVADRTVTHPVRDYLEGLAWDGVARLDTWLMDYMGVDDTPLARSMGAKWLVAAVARIMRPGCQVDNVLVIKGAQGAGKSSALRTLAGEDWFTDALIDFRSTDAPRGLAGVWLYELAELDSLQRSAQSAAKAFLTTRVDHYRAPYARFHVDVPRQCVFAATTNEGSFLADSTGSRRFWVVEARLVDVRGIAEARDQLWAEALVRYHSGAAWYLSVEEEAERATQADGYRQVDPWEAPIAAWMANRVEVIEDELLTTVVGKPVEHQTRSDGFRVANIMQALGFERRRLRRGGSRTNVWVAT